MKNEFLHCLIIQSHVSSFLMNSNNDENVDSPKQPQLKDNHFSCSLKELQAMQLMLFCNQW